MTVNIDDFSRKILRPMILHAIAQGEVDDAIVRSDVLEVIGHDREVMEAIKQRLIVMDATGKLR